MSKREQAFGARLRRPRGVSAIEYNLALWNTAVRKVEATYRSGRPYYPDLPCCDPVEDGVDARSRLEGIVRRGGKSGRRVAAVLAELDERFIASTEENPEAAPWLAWWQRREHADTLR